MVTTRADARPIGDPRVGTRIRARARIRSSPRAPEAAGALSITARELAHLGIVDEVVPEPIGGAHKDVPLAARTLQSAILRQLRELKLLAPDDLQRHRYDRFRKFGVFED